MLWSLGTRDYESRIVGHKERNYYVSIPEMKDMYIGGMAEGENRTGRRDKYL